MPILLASILGPKCLPGITSTVLRAQAIIELKQDIYTKNIIFISNMIPHYVLRKHLYNLHNAETKRRSRVLHFACD